MSHPPTGRHGQSPPGSPHGSPQRWAPPAWRGSGGQPPATGSGPAAAPQLEPWATGPTPWNQQPGVFPDFGDTPRRKRTALIIGVVAAVVLAGGVSAAVLLAGGGNDTTAAPGGPAQAAPAAGSVPSGRPAAAPARIDDPASVARALVDTINARDIPRYADLLCVKPNQSVMDQLKTDWDGDPSLHADLDGQPTITDAQATVTVRLTYHGQFMTPILILKQQGSAWCADIPT